MRASGKQENAALAALLLAVAALAGCGSGKPTPPSQRDNGPVTESPTGDPERLARARLELAGLYFGRGQSAAALDDVKAALAARPDLPEAWSLRGLIFASIGEPAQAEDSFRRALQLAPRDGDTLQKYGWFLCQQQRFADADAQFDNAIIQPQFRDTVRTLLAQGVCQARAGRWPEAERTLQRSYELDPANPATAFSLSEVLMRRGAFERARFYVGRINAVPEQTSASSLWLAARIERRMGNQAAADTLGRQLQDRYPQSAEALLYERGRFDE